MQPTIEQLMDKIRHLPPEQYELADKALDYIARNPDCADRWFWQIAGLDSMWKIWDNEEDAIYDDL